MSQRPSSIVRWTAPLLAAFGCLAAGSWAFALDEFDRHTAFWLRQAAEKSPAVQELTTRQAAELPLLGPGITSPCIVVRTNEGNFAKLLVSWGFRKQGEDRIPVLIIDRYVTYDRDRPNIARASGKDVMLFAGFLFDLDIGQVVPAEQGGDISFTEARRLVSLGDAALHPLSGSIVPGSDEARPDPLDHQGVLPRDFAGAWRIDVDGRLKGALNLSVDEDGNIHGSFLSEETKSDFPLTGITDGSRIQFEVQFAVATQAFDLYLWTTDKSRMAGTTQFLDRRSGVIAVRDAAPAAGAAEKPPATDEKSE